jgi:hypothetical protein
MWNPDNKGRIFATALTAECRSVYVPPPKAHWLSVESLRILIILTFPWALRRLEKILPSGPITLSTIPKVAVRSIY